MKRKNILLIGAGQLGSRHLQALARLEAPACISVVDQSLVSLDRCRTRLADVSGHDRHQYDFRQDLSQIPAIDLAVVATPADVRRRVVEELMANTPVRYMLLEKVLFQSSSDCQEVGALLARTGTRTWVNAPRRMWSCYKHLKVYLQNEDVQSLTRSGSGWGLACNGYHMLDLFAWLADSPLRWLSSKGIHDKAIPSKRPGFFELQGTLSGSLASGTHIVISDHPGPPKDAFILIETASRLLHLSEKTRQVSVVAGDPLPGSIKNLDVSPEFQSDLTDKVALQLFGDGECELTTYREASEIHEKMLTALAPCFAGSEEGEGLCPIT